MKKTELKGKYLIAFDTICDGHQVGTDENNEPCPQLFDSYDEAFKEMFIDARCGIQGNELAFEDDEEIDRDVVIGEMNGLIIEGDVEKMKDYLEKNQDANYYGEFVEKADEFILGRKAIYTGQGIVIEGTKLEDL